MTTVAVVSTKGGVAKTTTAVAVASALAQWEPTILVDGDPQGQVGLHFGMELRSNVYAWLMREKPIEQCVDTGRPSKLAVVVGSTRTRKALRWYRDRPEDLARFFRELPSDFVVIDTGGTGGLLQEIAVQVADIVIIPFHCERAGVDGVQQSLLMVDNLAPMATTILLPTAYNRRWVIHRENLALMQAEYPHREELMEKFAIPDRVAVKEAIELGQTVWEVRGEGIQAVRGAYSLLVSRILAHAGYERKVENYEFSQ